MPSTTTILHDELTQDPKALGYAPLIASGADASLAALLNATYPSVGTVYRPALRAADILACIVAAEAAAMDLLHVTWLAVLLTPGAIDASNGNVRALFTTLFSGAPQTMAALGAAAKVAAPTRAEELFGAGAVMTSAQIASALRP